MRCLLALATCHLFLPLAPRVSAAPQTTAELGVPGPILCPIQHRPFWRLERELFGYQPRFVPGVVTFGPKNRPYIRAEGAVQTLDEKGQWVRLDFAKFVQAKYPNWDGKFGTGPFAEEHVVFDDGGDAYMIVNATRSSIKQLLLLHSADRVRTWQVHTLGPGRARLERRDGHNQLKYPPPVLLYPDRDSGLLRLVLPAKTPDASLDVSNVVEITRDSYLVPNHSGGGRSVASQPKRMTWRWRRTSRTCRSERAG